MSFIKIYVVCLLQMRLYSTVVKYVSVEKFKAFKEKLYIISYGVITNFYNFYNSLFKKFTITNKTRNAVRFSNLNLPVNSSLKGI